MKRIIRILCYCAIGFSVVFLNSLIFAQELTVDSRTEITKIPIVRIIDWKGETPIVNGEDGWQVRRI